MRILAVERIRQIDKICQFFLAGRNNFNSSQPLVPFSVRYR